MIGIDFKNEGSLDSDLHSLANRYQRKHTIFCVWGRHWSINCLGHGANENKLSINSSQLASWPCCLRDFLGEGLVLTKYGWAPWGWGPAFSQSCRHPQENSKSKSLKENTQVLKLRKHYGSKQSSAIFHTDSFFHTPGISADQESLLKILPFLAAFTAARSSDFIHDLLASFKLARGVPLCFFMYSPMNLPSGTPSTHSLSNLVWPSSTPKECIVSLSLSAVKVPARHSRSVACCWHWGRRGINAIFISITGENFCSSSIVFRFFFRACLFWRNSILLFDPLGPKFAMPLVRVLNLPEASGFHQHFLRLWAEVSHASSFFELGVIEELLPLGAFRFMIVLIWSRLNVTRLGRTRLNVTRLNLCRSFTFCNITWTMAASWSRSTSGGRVSGGSVHGPVSTGFARAKAGQMATSRLWLPSEDAPGSWMVLKPFCKSALFHSTPPSSSEETSSCDIGADTVCNKNKGEAVSLKPATTRWWLTMPKWKQWSYRLW